MKRHSTLAIDRNIPARLYGLQGHHFEALSAAARATKTHAPILSIIARKHKISGRQQLRQAVAIDNREGTG
jgi:hypothetical protein